MRGDFEAAWRVCDRVLAERRGRDCSRSPRHLQHIWNGAPLAGRRVLVRCYHGLGDTLQFVRLLAPLREQAQHVTLWVQPPLLDLLQETPGMDALLPLHDGAPDADYDVDIELMEVAHALRLTIGDLPGPIPYLHVSPSRDPLTLRNDDALRVGIAWRSGAWNGARSLPIEAVRMLTDAPQVRWFSLQYPPEPALPCMVQLGCRDVRELAARMLTLDLVISVDTVTAHLAGALGLPVWTVLPRDCDWRWMRERSDSPWYPTMQLFRQSRAAGWGDVLAELSSALTRARDTR
jgi:hypothetical protein